MAMLRFTGEGKIVEATSQIELLHQVVSCNISAWNPDNLNNNAFSSRDFLPPRAFSNLEGCHLSCISASSWVPIFQSHAAMQEFQLVKSGGTWWEAAGQRVPCPKHLKLAYIWIHLKSLRITRTCADFWASATWVSSSLGTSGIIYLADSLWTNAVFTSPGPGQPCSWKYGRRGCLI